MIWSSGTLYSNASISPLSSLQVPTKKKSKLDAIAQAKLTAKMRQAKSNLRSVLRMHSKSSSSAALDSGAPTLAQGLLVQ